ncbi:hypothetical protein FLCH110379_01605 [Flavobacterium chungbukense]
MIALCPALKYTYITYMVKLYCKYAKIESCFFKQLFLSYFYKNPKSQYVRNLSISDYF